jgi:hypothetical protein
VVGYGIGPLFLAPITEIPQIGRNLPYIVPLAIFCILQIPTALVDNFAGFCILRFIAGFVSSPPLATGGESSSSPPPSFVLPLFFYLFVILPPILLQTPTSLYFEIRGSSYILFLPLSRLSPETPNLVPLHFELKSLATLSLRSECSLPPGASLFDIFSPRKITYSMGLYDLACAAGPTLGPIVAGFAVVANGWRWAFWEMLWITGFALASLSFSMPEVSLSSFFLHTSPFSSCFVFGDRIVLPCHPHSVPVYWRVWYRSAKLRWRNSHLRKPDDQPPLIRYLQ